MAMKMYLLNSVELLCLLQIAFTHSQPMELSNNYSFLPRDTFCLFTTSEFVYPEIMAGVAPSAKLHGAGKLKNFQVFLPDTSQPVTGATKARAADGCYKNVWGATYYISRDDYKKVEQLAYKQSMVSTVMVTLNGKDDTECISMDIGLLPQAFPFSIYSNFCPELYIQDYMKHLKEIGVPEDYVCSLAMLPTHMRDVPRSYIAPSSFSGPPPAITPTPEEAMIATSPLQIQPYDLPADKVCVFAVSDLIFPDAMVIVAPSATLIGAGMLTDNYIGLGGKTDPEKQVKYEGFDNIWGATYMIDQSDLSNFTSYGETFYFMTDVKTQVKQLNEVSCKTFDIGLIPSGFPFSVFQDFALDVQTYISQLKTLGVPSYYVEAMSNLAKSFPDSENKKVPQQQPTTMLAASSSNKNAQADVEDDPVMTH